MENLLDFLFATENGFEFIGDRSDLLSGFRARRVRGHAKARGGCLGVRDEPSE
jgi:hypothetical protein